MREEQREGTRVYVLHTAPGPDQFLVRTRDAAVTQALACAKRQGACAWFTTDETYDFVLLGLQEDFLRRMLERLRAEFLEMPGLRLQPEQVQRLCGFERMTCQLVLDSLVDEKLLCVKSDGAYARLTDGEISDLRAAKADLRTDRRATKTS